MKAEYFDALNFGSHVVTRVDPTVNFDWGYGAPAAGVGVDTFSVRWSGHVQAEKSEEYTFHTESDDGVRLWVNDQLIIDNWTVHAPTTNTGKITLEAGQMYAIRMEYFDNYNGAVARLSWSSPSTPKQIIPQNRLYSAPVERPTLSIVATDQYASEPGDDVGVFTISRTGDTTNPLTIRVSTSGTASGTDYTTDPLYGGYITIPAGQASTTLTIVPIDDDQLELPETVSIALQPFVWDPVNIDPEHASATVIIADNEPPLAPGLISVVAKDAEASEAGDNVGIFTISRSGSTVGDLEIRVAVDGTASVSDYTSDMLDGWITIPDGQSSVDVVVRPIDDLLVEGDETLVLDLQYYQLAWHQIDPTRATATITIADNDTVPVIAVEALEPTASEEGSKAAVLRFSHTGSTDVDQTLRLWFGGSADLDDFKFGLWMGNVTIPAGQSFIDVNLVPIDDGLVEGTETFTVSLSPSYNGQEVDPLRTKALITILDNDQPPVGDSTYLSDFPWESATSPYSGVKKDKATLGGPLTINGDVFDKGLGVHAPSTLIYNLGGQYTTFTAMVGVDDAVGNGSIDGNVIFQVWVDGVLKESVVRTGADAAQAISVDVAGANQLKLITTTNGSDYKDHADWADAKLLSGPIVEKPIVSVSGVTTEATEGEAGALEFRFTRTGPADEALAIRYTLTGTASNNADYVESPSTWTTPPLYSLYIPAGETSALLTLSMFTDDTEYEGDETAIVTLLPDTAYNVDAAASTATGIIHDNDPAPAVPTVTITALDDSIVEQYPDGGTTIRVTRSGGDISQALPVVLEAGGTAEIGVDWQPYPSFHDLVIPAGQTYVEFGIGAIRDLAVEGDESIILNLKTDPGYAIGAEGEVNITLVDNDFYVDEEIYLSDRTPASVTSPYFGLHTDQSVMGRPLTIGGQTYDKGLGVHSASRLAYTFSTQTLTHFSAWVGIDDEVGNGSADGSAVFQVWADGVLVASSDRLTGADGPQFLEVDLNDPTELVLVTTTGGDSDYKDHADWGDVKISHRVLDGIF